MAGNICGTSAFTWQTTTNAMDSSTMTSEHAIAARAKSALVMQAVKRGDMKEADRLMAQQRETEKKEGGSKGWVSRFGRKKGKQSEVVEGKTVDGDEESVYSVEVEKVRAKAEGKRDDEDDR
ncbi:unnamed protein product [Zymoseptoria tritici ST99CH_3D1]|nr:unnamed protein product [Zymoseptoria tritici ST99CH_3D1]